MDSSPSPSHLPTDSVKNAVGETQKPHRYAFKQQRAENANSETIEQCTHHSREHSRAEVSNQMSALP